MERLKKDNDFSAIEIYSPELVKFALSRSLDLTPEMVPDVSVEQLDKALEGLASSYVESHGGERRYKGHLAGLER